MTANQLLISIIGLFFLITGLMYVSHLKTKSGNQKRERAVSWALIGIGALIMLLPFFSFVIFERDTHSEPNKSALLGEEAFGDAVPSITGSYDEAKKAYEKAVKLWNKEISGFDSITVALSYLNKSIELYETSEALTARGQLKVQLAKMKEALPDYNRAIELNDEYGNAYFNRAGLYYILGDTKNACPDWKMAMVYGVPNTEDVYNSFCN